MWAAKRIPDGEVGVSANIARIGKLERGSRDFYCSDNCEAVAKKYGLWDGQGDFVFWKAFGSSYSAGKNFREREFFVLSSLAPSLNLSMDMDELPFMDVVEIEGSEAQVARLEKLLGLDKKPSSAKSYYGLYTDWLAERGRGPETSFSFSAAISLLLCETSA